MAIHFGASFDNEPRGCITIDASTTESPWKANRAGVALVIVGKKPIDNVTDSAGNTWVRISSHAFRVDAARPAEYITVLGPMPNECCVAEVEEAEQGGTS